MSATTPADRIDATTSLPHARAHRAATVVREVFWRSLSPLAKFTALGLGYRPPIQPSCRCQRCP